MASASIRLFLAEGDPKRLRTVEMSNWTGKAIAGPRSELEAVLGREEAEKPGVYFLSGSEPGTGEAAIYVGEAENIKTRLAPLEDEPHHAGVASVALAPHAHLAVAVERGGDRGRQVVEPADPLRIAGGRGRHRVVCLAGAGEGALARGYTNRGAPRSALRRKMVKACLSGSDPIRPIYAQPVHAIGISPSGSARTMHERPVR